ncbi:unnamed protein product [Blumeria hordei]|uniref:Uncharacterized protein n=1 Tax=Blumeria hordei TaxID=2867405 RepID=A0A383UI70_BLUHO|nr:unnamed protein product [Blumeria hordei]
MHFTVRQSTTKFRRLHIILFLTISVIGLTLQADISGYICDDLVVPYDKVVEVAKKASEFVKSVDGRYRFPALLEDTQLFGVEGQNMFVVPFRRFDSMRSGGNKGRDRIVLDASGNFKGVVYDTNDGNVHPMPTYRKCRPFLDDKHLELEKYIDDGYQISGFACGSNFLDRDVETNLYNECIRYISLPQKIKDKYKFPRCRYAFQKINELWFQYNTNKNYDNKQTKVINSFMATFNNRCEFLNIKRISRVITHEEPCSYTWTAIPSAEATMTDSLFDVQSKNYKISDEFYACKSYIFRITSIQNHMFHIFSLLLSNEPSGIEHMMHRQGELLLWPMTLPERHEPRINHPLTFSIGFDRSNQFSGIYFVTGSEWTWKKAKPCPNFNLLESRLKARGSG